MTEVVDVIKIEITLHHCRERLEIGPLRAKLNWHWDKIAKRVLEPCSEGMFDIEDSIVIRHSHSGLHEIPEEGGGDN
jgi:hypothetical protein